MDRRAWSLLIVLGAIWGASYMFIKIAVDDLSPGMVAWSRVALAALVLVALAAARDALAETIKGHQPHPSQSGLRPSARGQSTWGKVGVLALLGAVQVAGPFFLIGAGEEEISSSLAGILVTSAPLFTALLAIWVDHEERSQGLRLVGVLLGVVGVGVLLGLDLGGSGNELLGGLAIVLASLGYAVGGFLVKHRLGDAPPIGVAAWVMVSSTILLAPVALLTLPDAAPGLGPVAAVATLGVLGTGIAFLIFYDLIATIGPARAFVVTYLAPGFAVVYGATLLDETITVATIAGLALILAGSWLAAEGRWPRWLRRGRRARGEADFTGRLQPAPAPAPASNAPGPARPTGPPAGRAPAHGRSHRPTRTVHGDD
jgi:drug/metabolite transporter (DMT)-like permease